MGSVVRVQAIQSEEADSYFHRYGEAARACSLYPVPPVILSKLRVRMVWFLSTA